MALKDWKKVKNEYSYDIITFRKSKDILLIEKDFNPNANIKFAVKYYKIINEKLHDNKELIQEWYFKTKYAALNFAKEYMRKY